MIENAPAERTNGTHAAEPAASESAAPPDAAAEGEAPRRRRTRARTTKPAEGAEVAASEASADTPEPIAEQEPPPAKTGRAQRAKAAREQDAAPAEAPETREQLQNTTEERAATAAPATGEQQHGGGDGNRERWGRRDRRDRGGQRNGRQERQFNRKERDPNRRNGFEQFDEAYERELERNANERSALPSLNLAELQAETPEQLLVIAEEMGLQDISGLRKQDLIFRLLQGQAEARGNIFAGGFLEVSDDGNYGFLRGERMLPGPHDIYVSQSQLRRFALRPGDYVTGQVRQPRDNEKYYGLLKVEAVNGTDPDTARRRPHFENLTAIFPNQQLKLETTHDNLTHRLIDLVAPIGRGSRGLIVSPPKAGKTMLLKNIANGITSNYPDVHLLVLLIGERPEEVTDMQRTVRGEVVSSTFDEPMEDHTRVAEMALERAKRLVETGKDVVILLDSITRLVRAYNLALPPSGRTLSGGVDPIALYPPKRLFGAARKCEEGGSLTIIATCLVDTGSRMDEVVFEEFKGTGNLELRLDRRLAERRFYPAIDIQASSTRREELLLDEKTLKGVWLVRRMTAMISQNSPNQLEATERLLDRLTRTTTNEEFLTSLKTDL